MAWLLEGGYDIVESAPEMQLMLEEVGCSSQQIQIGADARQRETEAAKSMPCRDVRGAPVSNSPSWAGLGCSFVLAARDQMDGWRAAEAGVGWRSGPLDIYSSLILALEV